MKIVATTSCATGIAHMYIAAEIIKKECKKKGYVCKVKTQGVLGIENKLLEKGIETTDLIVFTNDVGTNKVEYFGAYKGKIIRHTPHRVIQEPNIIFETLK